MIKNVDVFTTSSEKREFRLYDEDLRKLFNLPVHTGAFTAANIEIIGVHAVVTITFAKVSEKPITLKLTGGK